MSEQSELEGASADLPTPPFGHPCLEKVLYLGKPQDRTFRSEEGIFTREWFSEVVNYLGTWGEQKLSQEERLGEKVRSIQL